VSNGAVIDVPARDGYDEYFAEKLWSLVPAVHRHEDGIARRPDVLRAIVEVIAGQAAIVRRSNDRLWEDQFIELCEDWAVPYIGDLVGTRLVSALNRRGRRVDVARTIHYRRRKGTLVVQEELTRDITGWEGTAVEEFRRLARARHGLDARLTARNSGRHSGTPPGGIADLRSQRAGDLVDGPFDEYHRTPDVRRFRGVEGRYGIPKLGLHVYRLRTYEVTGVRARPRGAANRFTVDPSGRELPLFMPPTRPTGDAARRPREWEVPGPMECRLLGDAQYELTEAIIQGLTGLSAAVAAGLRRLRGVRLRDEVTLAELVGAMTGLTGATLDGLLASLRPVALIQDCGKRALLSQGLRITEGGNPVPVDQISAANLGAAIPANARGRLLVDPERGQLAFQGSAAATPVLGTYSYGFAADIGAGPYDRHDHVNPAPNKLHQPLPAAAPQLNSADVLNQGVVEIVDSDTYRTSVTKLAVQDATLQAANQRRPYLQLLSDMIFGTGANANALLTLDGLWVGEADLVLRGDYRLVRIRHCTLDPGGVDADGTAVRAVRLVIEANVDRLEIESSIVGSIVFASGGTADEIAISDSIVDVRGSANLALDMTAGMLELERVTVFGALNAHRLYASEALVTGHVEVTDNQAGCFRFSAAPDGSRLPRPYRSHVLKEYTALFESRVFGRPGYAHLATSAPDALLRGAENGSEMGALSALMDPIKLDSLRTKVDEYLPFGLIPLFIKET
jgi:hypothetical protein